MLKKIVVLGSTGSIGTQTLDVVDNFPDRFEIVALAGGSNIGKLAEQANKYRPKLVSVGNKDDIKKIKSMISDDIIVTGGAEGLIQAAVMDEADTVVTSVTGTLGLIPTIEAIKAGKNIALANKETLVAAGEIVMSLISQYGVSILPVDSEHSAIFQCLNGENRGSVNKLTLTASGGPFFNKTPEELAEVTVEDALKHPNWAMGRKITVDSASMMNKGLEVIEARWLFNVSFDKIDVIVHPQSIIHSMVEFSDGSVIAQMGRPDMRLPIQYALSYPDRWENNFPQLDLLSIGKLTFDKPRSDVFPCLNIAYEAGRQGGTMPAVMNAANEAVVNLFLQGKVKFTEIPLLIEKVMANHQMIAHPDIYEILESDRWAREEVYSNL